MIFVSCGVIPGPNYAAFPRRKAAYNAPLNLSTHQASQKPQSSAPRTDESTTYNQNSLPPQVNLPVLSASINGNIGLPTMRKATPASIVTEVQQAIPPIRIIRATNGNFMTDSLSNSKFTTIGGLRDARKRRPLDTRPTDDVIDLTSPPSSPGPLTNTNEKDFVLQSNDPIEMPELVLVSRIEGVTYEVINCLEFYFRSSSKTRVALLTKSYFFPFS